LPAENSSYAAGLLLHFGVFERIFEFPSIGKQSRDDLGVRQYSSMEKARHFTNGLGSIVPDTDGRPRLDVPLAAELYAAHLAARASILSVIGADRDLPKVTQELGVSERPFVNTELGVKWHRAIGVLVGILVGQLVAIVVVLFACRRVFVRDHDSYLSVARLLKTAMGKVEGRTMDTGRELADYLGAGGQTMTYGTRQCGDEGYEVDLWDNVDDQFPDGSYQ